MTKKYRHNEATGEVYVYVDSAEAYVYIGKVIRGRRSLKRVIKDYEEREEKPIDRLFF
jgi:hypothetical protein